MTKYVNNNGVSEMWLNIKNWVTSQLLGYSQTGHTHSASDITSGLATVATSGSYNDLSNKPTIPTVNNATLTIQQNGVNVQTFTANASTNATANITVPTKTSDLTNDSGFITSDNTKIPLAGTNALAGSIVPSRDNVYTMGSITNQFGFIHVNSVFNHNVSTELALGNANDGADIALCPKEYLDGFFRMRAYDGTTRQTLQGRANGTLIWSGQPIQYVSDQRLKQQITQIDDVLLTAWEDVNPVQFKYNDAVELKSDNARLHTGYVVQQIDEACKKHNVDISEYGLYCHEEYPEETEEVEVEQADGTKTKERKVIREASEHYSLRYTEALIVECAYLRKCIKELRNEIEQLKGSK